MSEAQKKGAPVPVPHIPDGRSESEQPARGTLFTFINCHNNKKLFYNTARYLASDRIVFDVSKAHSSGTDDQWCTSRVRTGATGIHV